MNLAEVLTAILSAEDEAADSVEGAKRKASDLLRETREKFSADQEARLNAARVQAKAIVESARHSAELEGAHISDMGLRGRQKMKDQFAEKAPSIVAALAAETAERYAKKGEA